MKKIGIGLAGYGSIGKVHTLCYKQLSMLYPNTIPPIRLVGVCTSKEESAQKAKKDGGFEQWYTSIEEMVKNPDIDVIDCSLPNYLRMDAIRLALANNKHIYCEKPLANSLEEAKDIAALVQESGIKFGMTFNFRFVPAILRAKELIDSGAIGDIYHFNIKYYHTGYQNTNRPMSWRLEKSKSGGGALVDMGAHIIDIIRVLAGELTEVSARTHTWIKQRPLSKNSEQSGTVDVDDAAWLQIKTQSGAIGSLETSRFATGTLDDLIFDVFGSKGALHFNLMDANWLYYYDEGQAGGNRGGLRGWQRLETVQHYPGASTPPARSIIGWARTHAENQYQFLKSVAENTLPTPSIHDGLAVQNVLDAAYRSAENNGALVNI